MNIERDPRWAAYQSGDARRLLAALKRVRRVLYVLPTGGGKTVVACWLIEQWRRAGKRVVVLVHRSELLEQMYRTLTEGAGVPEEHVGVVWRDDERTRPEAPIQVVSIDTSIRRKRYPKADYVVPDEAHHGVSAKWARVFGWYSDARVLGLTATPVRLDGKPLKEAFDEMVLGPSIEKLIELGHLMKPRVFVREGGKSIDLTNVRRVAGDYERGELERRAMRRNVVAGTWEHVDKHAQGRNGIVFACGLTHCARLAAEGAKRGKSVRVVTGKTGLRERRELLKPGGWLDSGARRYVVTCDVLSEGFDLPSVKLVVSVRPTMSEALYLHQCGRILRPYRDKWWTPMILDLTRNTMKFGRPQDQRDDWSLDGERRKHGKQGALPLAKVCPECEEACAPGTKTCACGYVFPIVREPAEVAGRLVEIGAATEAEKRRTLERAMAIARAKKHPKPEEWAREVVRMAYGESA